MYIYIYIYTYMCVFYQLHYIFYVGDLSQKDSYIRVVLFHEKVYVACMCVYVYINMDRGMCRCTYIHTYIHTYIYIYMRTYIHAVHTCITCTNLESHMRVQVSGIASA